MSEHSKSAESLMSCLPRTLPAALRLTAQDHASVRLVFHTAASVAEVALKDIYQRACSVAAGLEAVGVRPGEVVAVQLPHRTEKAVAHAAVMLAGAVLLPVGLSWGPHEVHRMLRRSNAAVLITSAWRAHDVLRARTSTHGLPRLRHVVAVTGTWPAAGVPADALDWELLERFRRIPAAVAADPDDPALIAHTPLTGTTPPRAVVHTHASLLAELATMPPMPGRTPGHVHLAPPTSGGLIGTSALLRALVTGLPTVFMDRWDSLVAADLVHSRRITSATLSGLLLGGLLDAAARTGRGLAGLQDCFVTCGGLTRGLVEQADHSGIAAYGGYGLAEHPTITAGSPRDPLNLRVAGAGRPMAGNAVRIVDGAGRDLPPGYEGDIMSKGPELFAGYLGRNTESPTVDGWLRTGDRGLLDAEGRLYVSDANDTERTPRETTQLVNPGAG
jgi:acyl-CoA synthetase (AMP-forming)/AMP-acid ligase II